MVRPVQAGPNRRRSDGEGIGRADQGHPHGDWQSHRLLIALAEPCRFDSGGLRCHYAAVKKLFAEFLGTFGLVFAGTGAIVIDQVSNGAITHAGVALTFGLVVLAMIYAFG